MGTTVAAPGSQEPDWAGIRAAAAVVGVREAARQAARHLTPEEQERFVFRVLKRSQRQGWVVATRASEAAAQPLGKPLSSIVLKGSDVINNTLAERHRDTKLSLSKWAARGSKHLAKLKGESALAATQAAVGVATVMGKLWPEQAGDDRVALQFFSITMQDRDERPVIDLPE